MHDPYGWLKCDVYPQISHFRFLDYTNFHVWISQALINNNQYEKTITFIFYFNVIFSGIGPMSYQVAAIMSAITGIFKSVRNHMFYLSFGVFCVLYVLAVIIFMTIVKTWLFKFLIDIVRIWKQNFNFRESIYHQLKILW